MATQRYLQLVVHNTQTILNGSCLCMFLPYFIYLSTAGQPWRRQGKDPNITRRRGQWEPRWGCYHGNTPKPGRGSWGKKKKKKQAKKNGTNTPSGTKVFFMLIWMAHALGTRLFLTAQLKTHKKLQKWVFTFWSILKDQSLSFKMITHWKWTILTYSN